MWNHLAEGVPTQLQPPVTPEGDCAAAAQSHGCRPEQGWSFAKVAVLVSHTNALQDAPLRYSRDSLVEQRRVQMPLVLGPGWKPRLQRPDPILWKSKTSGVEHSQQLSCALAPPLRPHGSQHLQGGLATPQKGHPARSLHRERGSASPARRQTGRVTEPDLCE